MLYSHLTNECPNSAETFATPQVKSSDATPPSSFPSQSAGNLPRHQRPESYTLPNAGMHSVCTDQGRTSRPASRTSFAASVQRRGGSAVSTAEKPVRQPLARLDEMVVKAIADNFKGVLARDFNHGVS